MARWYGSINNRVDEMATKGQPEPVVDMGVTITHYSDRDGGTVLRTWKEGSCIFVEVQVDKATRTDKNGMSESQEYSYERNPKGQTYTFRADGPNGRWKGIWKNPKTGRWNKSEGCGLRLGERDAHHDFSF